MKWIKWLWVLNGIIALVNGILLIFSTQPHSLSDVLWRFNAVFLCLMLVCYSYWDERK